jgi:hypothetical protein
MCMGALYQPDLTLSLFMVELSGACIAANVSLSLIYFRA